MGNCTYTLGDGHFGKIDVGGIISPRSGYAEVIGNGRL